MIPGVVVIKDRPLAPGHRLYAVRAPGRVKKDTGCIVDCSCGERLTHGSVARFQKALDLAARSHLRLIAQCESCGRAAKIRLADGSTWCLDCHGTAIALDYDQDWGELIASVPA